VQLEGLSYLRATVLSIARARRKLERMLLWQQVRLIRIEMIPQISLAARLSKSYETSASCAESYFDDDGLPDLEAPAVVI
jgi:hypothetical protein